MPSLTVLLKETAKFLREEKSWCKAQATLQFKIWKGKYLRSKAAAIQVQRLPFLFLKRSYLKHEVLVRFTNREPGYRVRCICLQHEANLLEQNLKGVEKALRQLENGMYGCANDITFQCEDDCLNS